MDYEKFRVELLQDPEVKAEYDRLGPEYEIIEAIIDARHELKLSQQALATKTGIHQSRISKLEKGLLNPSLDTLKRLADGIGKDLHIEFRERQEHQRPRV